MHGQHFYLSSHLTTFEGQIKGRVFHVQSASIFTDISFQHRKLRPRKKSALGSMAGGCGAETQLGQALSHSRPAAVNRKPTQEACSQPQTLSCLPAWTAAGPRLTDVNRGLSRPALGQTTVPCSCLLSTDFKRFWFCFLFFTLALNSQRSACLSFQECQD